MADSIIEIKKRHFALPFSEIKNTDEIANLYISTKNRINEKLVSNNFSKNMINHVNGFSKNNYTCSYYQEEGIFNLPLKHLADCLKLY